MSQVLARVAVLKELSKRAVALIFLSALFFSFQNCSQSADPLNGGKSPNDILSTKMDFSYEASIDQIAYMSCPALKTNVDTDSFYSIRAGAYGTAGIKLKDSFFQTYRMKTPERMADLLSNSPANNSTVLQMAVRQAGSLNSLVTGSGTPVAGKDYANLLVPLGSTEMSSNLVGIGLNSKTNAITGTKAKYMRLGTGGIGARFEGTLRFGDSEGLASSLRDTYLNTGAALFALTYVQTSASTNSSGSPSSGGSSTDARGPGDVIQGQAKDSTHAYGSGFRLSFLQPPGARGWMQHDSLGNVSQPPKELTPYPDNILSQVTETNLVNPGDTSSVGSWVCPTNLRFRIVRSGDDLADASCARKPDPDPSTLSAADALKIKLARNSLRFENWYIDFDDHGANDGGCIIPKQNLGSCYGDMNYVQYNTSDPSGCDPNSTSATNSLTSKLCMAWVSVCYRSN